MWAKILLNKWREIAIVALIVVIIIMRSCQPSIPDRIDPQPIVIESTNYTPTITNEDKTIYLKYTETLIPDTIHDTIFNDNGDIDSLAIVQDWLTKRDYIDTLVNNDSALIIVSDEVWRNRIVNRSFRFILYPQPVLVPERRLKVFAGFGANGWLDKFGIQGSVALLTKRDNLYTLSYDPINKSTSLSVYWKISFRKRR